MGSYSNNFGDLTFYKSSLKGTVQDFVVSFNDNFTDIESIIDETFELVKHLFDKFIDFKARLIAKVNYFHLNEYQKIISERSYHFPSYQSENVINAQDFFTRHMAKIASRMDAFHTNGSNLIIDKIEHIHIAITKT